MPLASSAVAAAISSAASGWGARAREPATRDGAAGAARGTPRSRIRHERSVSSPRAPSTAFRAVRGGEDDPGSLDEDDPPLSPARAAADPRRPSRDLRSPVESGASYYGRPSRADVERNRRSERTKTRNGRRRRSGKGDLATLADGAEVFLIATAAGVAALRASERADLDARRWRARDRLLSSTAANDASTPQKILDSREHRAAVASVLSDPALFAAPASHTWLADLALVAAVALGAVLRRVANGGNRRGARGPGDDAARSAAASSDSVLARVRRLESAHDRVALAASRNARDLSKVSTRVRLVRRELSPAVRKVEAESAAREAEAAALAARVRRLGEELRSSQRTVGALQGVTAKQFGALAKTLTDVKREADARRARRADVDDAPNATNATKRLETFSTTEAVEADGGGTKSDDERGDAAESGTLVREEDSSRASPGGAEANRRSDDSHDAVSSFSTSAPREEAFGTGEGKPFAARDARVARMRRRRFLTFRVGGAAKTTESARSAAPGGDADEDDEDGEEGEYGEADEAAFEAPKS